MHAAYSGTWSWCQALIGIGSQAKLARSQTFFEKLKWYDRFDTLQISRFEQPFVLQGCVLTIDQNQCRDVQSMLATVSTLAACIGQRQALLGLGLEPKQLPMFVSAAIAMS